MKHRTKAGAHGALYRYAIRYDDGPDSGFLPDTWRCWAYDAEHALDLWHDSPDADTGWRILARPVREVVRS